MSGRNRFDERNVAKQRLLVATINVTAGATDDIIAAPGAGKRIRVYGIFVTQVGTATEKFSAQFEASSRVVFSQDVVNDGQQNGGMFGGHFVESDGNEALQYTVPDQASDDATFTVFYTVEDN